MTEHDLISEISYILSQIEAMPMDKHDIEKSAKDIIKLVRECDVERNRHMTYVPISENYHGPTEPTFVTETSYHMCGCRTMLNGTEVTVHLCMLHRGK